MVGPGLTGLRPQRPPTPAPPLRIGLTGGIGSGKSTVAGLLEGLGAAVVDTDAISRRLTGPGGAAMASIEAAFGTGLVGADGALDRQRMRALVFAGGSGDGGGNGRYPDADADADAVDAGTTTPAGAKQRLEAILHPMIRDETERQVGAAVAAGALCVVLDVPLLIESGHWLDRVDKVLVVDCSDTTQLERVSQRPGWTIQAARAVIGRQASRAERVARADAVILNDGISLPQLAQAVRDVWQHWIPAAA